MDISPACAAMSMKLPGTHCASRGVSGIEGRPMKSLAVRQDTAARGQTRSKEGSDSTVRPAAVPEIEPEGGRQTRSASLHVSFDGPRQEAGPRPELPLTCRWRGCVPSRGGTCSLTEENPSSTALTSILQTGGGATPASPFILVSTDGPALLEKNISPLLQAADSR